MANAQRGEEFVVAKDAKRVETPVAEEDDIVVDSVLLDGEVIEKDGEFLKDEYDKVVAKLEKETDETRREMFKMKDEVERMMATGTEQDKAATAEKYAVIAAENLRKMDEYRRKLAIIGQTNVRRTTNGKRKASESNSQDSAKMSKLEQPEDGKAIEI